MSYIKNNSLKQYFVRICCLVIALSTLLLSSCFDLVEQIDMTHQGTGSIKATLNLSKSRTKVASLLKMKQINGIKIPSETEIRSHVQQVVKQLKATKGISQVEYSLDFTNYIATLSCHFDNVEALNDFSKTISNTFKTPITSYNSYSFNKAQQTFKRQYKYSEDMGKEFAKISTQDQKLFSEAYYTNIIRFNKTIETQQHPDAKVSSNKQAVLLKVKATDLITGKAKLGNTITLKK